MNSVWCGDANATADLGIHVGNGHVQVAKGTVHSTLHGLKQHKNMKLSSPQTQLYRVQEVCQIFTDDHVDGFTDFIHQ